MVLFRELASLDSRRKAAPIEARSPSFTCYTVPLRMAFKFAFATLVPLICAIPLPAQVSPPCPSTLIVNVIDGNGRPEPDVPKESFRVRINGHSATVRAAEYKMLARRIVLLLDRSGSMSGNLSKNKWSIAGTAAQDLISLASSQVPIAVVAFSEKVNGTVGFDRGRALVNDELKRVLENTADLKGHTALYDAILAGIEMLRPVQMGDAIYVITDGGDNVSKANGAMVRRALLENSVRLFTFLLGDPLTPEEASGADAIRELTRDTDGFLFGAAASSLFIASQRTFRFDPRAVKDIKLQTVGLENAVNGFYTLNIDGTPNESRSSHLSVEVVDDRGKPRKDLRLIFPRLHVLTCTTN